MASNTASSFLCDLEKFEKFETLLDKLNAEHKSNKAIFEHAAKRHTEFNVASCSLGIMRDYAPILAKPTDYHAHAENFTKWDTQLKSLISKTQFPRYHDCIHNLERELKRPRTDPNSEEFGHKWEQINQSLDELMHVRMHLHTWVLVQDTINRYACAFKTVIPSDLAKSQIDWERKLSEAFSVPGEDQSLPFLAQREIVRYKELWATGYRTESLLTSREAHFANFFESTWWKDESAFMESALMIWSGVWEHLYSEVKNAIQRTRKVGQGRNSQHSNMQESVVRSESLLSLQEESSTANILPGTASTTRRRTKRNTGSKWSWSTAKVEWANTLGDGPMVQLGNNQPHPAVTQAQAQGKSLWDRIKGTGSTKGLEEETNEFCVLSQTLFDIHEELLGGIESKLEETGIDENDRTLLCLYHFKVKYQQSMLEKYHNKLNSSGMSSEFRELNISKSLLAQEFTKMRLENVPPLTDLLVPHANWPSTSAVAVEAEAESENKAFSRDEEESADEVAQIKRRGSF